MESNELQWFSDSVDEDMENLASVVNSTENVLYPFCSFILVLGKILVENDLCTASCLQMPQHRWL